MSSVQVFRNTLIILGTLALAYLFILTLNVWIGLMIAILIASALRRPIMRLQQMGVRQPLAILIVYGLLGVVGVTLIIAVMPPLINQAVQYIQNDDRLANRIIIAQGWVERFLSQSTGSDVQLGINPDEIRASVHDVVDSIRVTAPTLVANIGSSLGDFLLIVVMGIYWITSRERAELFLISLLPLTRQAQARAIFDEIESRLGAYVRGVVTVMFVVGALCFTALTLLQIPGAATLSFVYAVATAIPIIGSTVGVALATGLALLSSPSAAVVVLIVSVVLQLLENHVLSPRIMAKNTDFDEILVIVFIAAGFTLNGVTGALIAIPVAGTMAILLKHLVLEPRKARVTPVKVEGGLLIDTATDTQSAPKILTPGSPGS